MRPNPIAAAREARIGATLAAVRALLATGAADAARLKAVAALLRALAGEVALFPPQHFAAPLPEEEDGLCHALSLDPDGPALYLTVLNPGTETPPHDHGTWAVIAGIAGCESHTLYEWAAEGLRPRGARRVAAGEGMVLLPEDVHALRVEGVAQARHLHLYGRPLGRQRRSPPAPIAGPATGGAG